MTRRSHGPAVPLPLPSPYDAAEYSQALIKSLRKFVAGKRLYMLAHLLELAELEATRLVCVLGEEAQDDARDRHVAGGRER